MWHPLVLLPLPKPFTTTFTMAPPKKTLETSKVPDPTTEPVSAVLLFHTNTAKPPHPALQDDPAKYPQGIKLATIVASIFAVVFVAALVSPGAAIP